jgi:hypothetical protein
VDYLFRADSVETQGLDENPPWSFASSLKPGLPLDALYGASTRIHRRSGFEAIAAHHAGVDPRRRRHLLTRVAQVGDPRGKMMELRHDLPFRQGRCVDSAHADDISVALILIFRDPAACLPLRVAVVEDHAVDLDDEIALPQAGVEDEVDIPTTH